MANHRTYCKKIMSYHKDIDEVQEWIVVQTAGFYNRLNNHATLCDNQLLKDSTWPETWDFELRLYRENLLKLLT